MSELTREYLDQRLDAKFAEERQATFERFDRKFEDKFDELLRTVKQGFDASATKQELQEVKQDITDLRKEAQGIRWELSQLTQTVNSLIQEFRRRDEEYVELKVRCHELEQRVARLEGFQPAA